MPQHIDLDTPLCRYSQDQQRHRRAALRCYLSQVAGSSPDVVDLRAIPVETAVRAVSLATIQHYANQRKAAQAKKASFQVLRQSILFMADQLAECEYIDYTTLERVRHFSMPTVASGHRPGIWLSREQAAALIDHTEHATVLSAAQRIRDTAMLTLLLVAGLRCEEMTRLRWEDITHIGPYVRLRVHGKGYKIRYLKLPAVVQARIAQWKGLHLEPTGKQFLFTALYKGSVTQKALGLGGIFQIVKNAGGRIGVPGLAPHDLRRTSARLAHEAGVPLPLIQQHLGHAQLNTTERYINPLLMLDNAAPDTLAAAIGSFFIDDDSDETPPVMPPVPVVDLLTRAEAAAYLTLSIPQFDHLRKRTGLVAASKKKGKTRTFSLFSRDDLDRLRHEKEVAHEGDGL